MQHVIAFFFCITLAASAAAQPAAANKPATGTATTTNSSDPFMPSASEIRDEPVTEDASDEIKKLQEKRWIQQDNVSKPQDTPAAKSKVSLTASCKDKSGREFKSDEAGYQGCLSEMQLERTREQAGATKDGSSGSAGKPTTGVGVQYQFGK